MADEDVQKTLEELSRDLQESKARLEEAQRIAQVGHYYLSLLNSRNCSIESKLTRSLDGTVLVQSVCARGLEETVL